MTETSIETTTDLHADKYNDPRAMITRRGILIGVAVAILGVVGAATSIIARRTQLGETTRFWGQETITALQLAERMELLPIGGSEFQPIDLTSTPGLGHLRRALLDERNFDWKTETRGAAVDMCQSSHAVASLEVPTCVQIRMTDPTGNRIGTVEIVLALSGGWVGPSDGSRRVQATEWVQPKLRNYFKTIMSVQQKRYDLRE